MTIFCIEKKKNTPFFKAEKLNSNDIQKCSFSQQFFNRSLVKSRRTAKRPTVLSSLLLELTIPTTIRKTNFLTNFRIFYKGSLFLQKNGKNQKFLGLNANRLEIKIRAQRGMTLLILIFYCDMPAKTLIYLV